MAAGIIVSRILGPERRGYMALVVQAATMIFSFTHLGVGSSITYFTGKKTFPRGNVLGFLLIFSAVFGGVFAGIFYFIYPYISNIWVDIPRDIMIIGLIAVPFIFFNNLFKRFLLAMLLVKQSNIANIIRYIVYLVLVAIFLFLFNGGTREVVISFTASMAITAAICLALFTKESRPLGMIRKDMIKPFFTYGPKLYLGFLFREINNRVGIFIIKYYMTASDVSYYQIALNISERLWLVPTALTFVLYPTLLAMKKDDSSRFSAKVCRNNLFFMVLLSVLLLIFGKFMVLLVYGEQYANVAKAIYSLLIAITIWPVYNMIAIDFASRDRIWVIVITSFIGAVVNITCNFIFIQRFGLIGAGMATCVSNIVMVSLIVGYFVRNTGIPLREVLVPTREDIVSYRDAAFRLLKKVRGMINRNEKDNGDGS